MKVFLAQMILGARNDDFEGWMQILLVVIMAVIYGLSGILKSAKSKKFGDEEDQQQGEPFDHAQGKQHHPARTTVVRRVYQAPPQPKHPESARPEPVTLKPVPSEQPVPAMAKEQQIELQLDARVQEIPKIKPEVEKLPEFVSPSGLGLAETDEKVKGLKHKHKHKRPHAAIPMEIAEAANLGEPLLDVNDPEAIRKAILHYEVFGKPLSLREQRE